MVDYSMFNILNSKQQLSGADKQMLFQERLSNSAHTREVEDLKNAGLNPVLSANHSGASTPSGSADNEPVDNPMYALVNGFNTLVKASGYALKRTAKSQQDMYEIVQEVLDQNERIISKDGSLIGTPRKWLDPSGQVEKANDLIMEMFNDWKKTNGRKDSWWNGAKVQLSSAPFVADLINTVMHAVDVDPFSRISNNLKYGNSGKAKEDINKILKSNPDLAWGPNGFYSISATNNFSKDLVTKVKGILNSLGNARAMAIQGSAGKIKKTGQYVDSSKSRKIYKSTYKGGTNR